MSGRRRTAAARKLASPARTLGLAALAAAIAGCSADVTRFNLLGGDFFQWGGSDAPATAGPASYVPAGRGYPADPRSSGYGGQESDLPPLAAAPEYRPPGRGYPPSSAPPYPPMRSEPLARAPDRAPPPWTDKDPFPWPEAGADKHKLAPSGPPAAWQARHVMSSGESLYAIAQRYKVSVDDLKRVNGITDPTKVWAGKVLSVPERRVAAAMTPAQPAQPPRVVQVTPRDVAPPPEAAPPAAPAPSRIAARPDGTMTDGGAAPVSSDGRFRWPARGKVVLGFGAQRSDGSKSEGINLAVPLGTEIHAVEAGRVHYVGDGLKGYGNLILIRHANGWVSTYAHADRMLVKAGDQVRRGQVIGTAGKSGPVSEPQLRFELRKGSQPVNPLAHLGS
jgi:murein DD-endopeptidase MepM/ murein hydrolase activator NlpD